MTVASFYRSTKSFASFPLLPASTFLKQGLTEFKNSYEKSVMFQKNLCISAGKSENKTSAHKVRLRAAIGLFT